MIRVYCDMDGVLTNFVDHIANFFNLSSEDRIFPKGCWNYIPLLAESIGISEDSLWNSLTVGFWEKMPKTDEADMILHLLERDFGDNVCVLSSPANALCAHGKVLWMKEYLPKYYKEGRFYLGRDKRFVAHNRSILIDDADHNIDKYRAYSGHAILYPRYWNSKHMIAEVPEQGYRYFASELSRIVLEINAHSAR